MAVHAASCLYNTHLAVSQGMPGTLKNKKADYVQSLTQYCRKILLQVGLKEMRKN